MHTDGSRMSWMRSSFPSPGLPRSLIHHRMRSCTDYLLTCEDEQHLVDGTSAHPGLDAVPPCRYQSPACQHAPCCMDSSFSRLPPCWAFIMHVPQLGTSASCGNAHSGLDAIPTCRHHSPACQHAPCGIHTEICWYVQQRTLMQECPSCESA